MKSDSQKRAASKSGEHQEASTVTGQQHGKTSSAKRQSASYQEQLTEDRAGRVNSRAPGSDPVGAMSSANSVSADPFSREKALGAPVPQVTRHI